MGYDDVTDRTDSAALIPEDAATDIIKDAIKDSVVLSRFRRITMSRAQKRMPALAAFPLAYWVNGDTGLKQTTGLAWENKFIDAEEVAVIVPVPEAVLDDSDYDMWAEIRPLCAEAIGRTVDEAVFFGTNAPAAFPDDIQTAALAAGNSYEYLTNDVAAGGLAEDVNGVMMTVEDDGFDVNGFLSYRGFRGKLRGARASDGQKLMDVSEGTIEGQPVDYGMDGLWPDPTASAATRLFAGDWTQFMCGLRQDITYKVLDQAVIQDAAGDIQFNLAQQDMVALRLVMRVGWNVANPLTHSQPTEADRYPAGLLVNATV